MWLRNEHTLSAGDDEHVRESVVMVENIPKTTDGKMVKMASFMCCEFYPN